MFESATSTPRFKARFPVKMPSFGFRGGRLVSLAFRLLLIISPLLFLRACFFTYVAPDQIGMRSIAFGPNKGLQKTLVRAGYRRQIAGYEKIQTFPRNIQLVDFTSEGSESAGDHRTVGAINVPTVDGYPVAVDVTVIYRVADPFLVVSRFGFGRAYEDNVVIRLTDSERGFVFAFATRPADPCGFRTATSGTRA